MNSSVKLVNHNFIIDVGRLCYENGLTTLLRNSPGVVKFHLQCAVFANQSDDRKHRYSPDPLDYMQCLTMRDIGDFFDIAEKCNSFVDHLYLMTTKCGLKDNDLVSEYKLMNVAISESAFKKQLYFTVFSSRLKLNEVIHKDYSFFDCTGSRIYEKRFKDNSMADFRVMFCITGCENFYYACRYGSIPKTESDIIEHPDRSRCIPLTDPETLVFGRTRAVLCFVVRTSALLQFPPVYRNSDSWGISDQDSGSDQLATYWVKGPDVCIKGILWPTGPGMVEVSSEQIRRTITTRINYTNYMDSLDD